MYETKKFASLFNPPINHFIHLISSYKFYGFIYKIEVKIATCFQMNQLLHLFSPFYYYLMCSLQVEYIKIPTGYLILNI